MVLLVAPVGVLLPPKNGLMTVMKGTLPCGDHQESESLLIIHTFHLQSRLRLSLFDLEEGPRIIRAQKGYRYQERNPCGHRLKEGRQAKGGFDLLHKAVEARLEEAERDTKQHPKQRLRMKEAQN